MPCTRQGKGAQVAVAGGLCGSVAGQARPRPMAFSAKSIHDPCCLFSLASLKVLICNRFKPRGRAAPGMSSAGMVFCTLAAFLLLYTHKGEGNANEVAPGSCAGLEPHGSRPPVPARCKAPAAADGTCSVAAPPLDMPPRPFPHTHCLQPPHSVAPPPPLSASRGR